MAIDSKTGAWAIDGEMVRYGVFTSRQRFLMNLRRNTPYQKMVRYGVFTSRRRFLMNLRRNTPYQKMVRYGVFVTLSSLNLEFAIARLYRGLD